MTFQIGSECATRSAPDGRSASGRIRSVILTYFASIATRRYRGTKETCDGRPPRLRRRRNRVLIHSGCRLVAQKDSVICKMASERQMKPAGGSVMAEKPYDRLDGVIWYDGKLVPWGDATLHVLSHGLHYASSVFEGERAYGGEIFRCTEHSERLKRSAQLLDFEIPFSIAEIDAAKRLVIEKNCQSDAYVRPIAWRGSEMMGVSAQNNKIHLAIATWQWPSYFDPVQRLKGIRLELAEYRRPDPATAPARAKAAGLYMICTISKHIAERKGYADAMMLDWQGRVAECTGANIFFVHNGRVHTPIADCFLAGITRATVIDLAGRGGIEVIERRIQPEELEGFEECFICGTGAEVTPVSEIGPYKFTPGPISRTLIEA